MCSRTCIALLSSVVRRDTLFQSLVTLKTWRMIELGHLRCSTHAECIKFVANILLCVHVPVLLYYRLLYADTFSVTCNIRPLRPRIRPTAWWFVRHSVIDNWVIQSVIQLTVNDYIIAESWIVTRWRALAANCLDLYVLHVVTSKCLHLLCSIFMQLSHSFATYKW